MILNSGIIKMKSLPVIICFLLGLTTGSPHSPSVLYVTGDGSGDYNCDGTHDQVEINHALDRVASDPKYTTVYLKGPHTYWIDEPILISSHCILKGDGNARVQVIDNTDWPVNKPLIAQKGAEYWAGGIHAGNLGDQIYGKDGDLLTDVEIAGFELTAGNQSADTGSWYYILMLFHLVDNISIHDMNLHDSYGDFIRMMGNSWEVSNNIIVYNNVMSSSGHEGLYFAGISHVEAYDNKILHTRTNDGIRFEECRKVSIHDNIIGNSLTSTSSGYAGILLANGSIPLGTAEIYNNFIYGKAGSIVLESGPTKNLQNGVHIHHNRIFQTFDNTAGKVDYLNGGIHIHGADNTLIEFNTIEGSQKDGIVFEIGHGTETGYQTFVKNNIIANCDNYGINNLSASHTFVIEHNDLYNCTNGHYNQSSSTTDLHADPLFKQGVSTNDPGLVDLHLQSEAGRWNGTQWITDTVTSPCIDAGISTSDFADEPVPNGGRVNIGAYGNTNQASRTPPSN